MATTTIGLDTAKTVFQIHGLDENGKVVLKRKLQRREVVAFFEQLPKCTVFLEACSAGHHWGRLLTGLGHDVRLVDPGAVKPFVKKGKKNDAVDAAALCVAGLQPEIRFVPIKTEAQQAVLALHAARSLLVKQATMLANAIRGLAGEMGLIAPQGLHRIGELMTQLEEAGIPAESQHALTRLFAHLQTTLECMTDIEEQIVRHARREAVARRLATIPGIGPITASLIAASVGDNIVMFRSARNFAAWVGLVPQQHSTGGKTRLGRITKAGNVEIRRLLVLGATSIIRRAAAWDSAMGLWLQAVLARRPTRLATVALANKMARIAWAVMSRGEAYQERGRAQAPATVAA